MLTDIPIFMDGSSEGSVWPLDPESEWPRVLSGEVSAGNRYLRVSDVIELLRTYEPKKQNHNS